ncbi:MAG: caspase family protein [Steroidobacteraceae bacterium]
MVRSPVDAKSQDLRARSAGRSPRRCAKAAFYALTVAEFFAVLIAALFAAQWPAAAAETRRAFLVGIERYSDGNIQPLTRAARDAKDLGKDLEQVGFDKKNIKVAVDLHNRDAFEKEFSAFLNAIEAGDDVLFYFSGHGFGVEADQTNYLLFGDLKSPFTYTKSQLSDEERRNRDLQNLVLLKIPQYLDAYQRNEIPNGISANEIQRRIAEKNPKTVIMILDACRSLVRNDAGETDEIKIVKRGEAGSRLLSVNKAPPGFIVLYSASFGEQALQDLGPYDKGENSVFTGVLRSELQRPGLSIVQLGKRVRLVVSSIAGSEGYIQEPEVFYDEKDPRNSVNDFFFVDSVGAERFQMSQEKCAGEDEDWEQIKDRQQRDLYERHTRRFDSCLTAELARRAIAALALTTDDQNLDDQNAVSVEASNSVSKCDQLASDLFDDARGDLAGVPLAKLDAEAAIAACREVTEPTKPDTSGQSRTKQAASQGPTAKPETKAPKSEAERFKPIPRYFFNLGRAYQKFAMTPGISDEERKHALESARFAYNDALSKGSYVSAFNGLAELYELDKNYQRAIELFERGAQQGHALAMYNLALHYKEGKGVPRDLGQAAEWFKRAGERGLVSAMVEWGLALQWGRGINGTHPLLAREQLQRAADAGSIRAERELAWIYYRSKRDPDLALLWFTRAAEAGDTPSQVHVAQLLEDGEGLPSPKPEIAERYWRLAAHGGDAFAEVQFADRLRRGFLLVKEEYGQQEIISLLEHALSQGSAQAAVALAQIYRNGELGVDKNALKAMKYAYRAIDLDVLADPTTFEGNPYYEMNAAQLLVEMARNGEAVDAAGRPLLSPNEVDRLEHYYGTVDPVTKRVKIRRLTIPIYCTKNAEETHSLFYAPEIWVWDWGRSEPPTEFQIRDFERKYDCPYNTRLRATLIDVYQQAKKDKVAFADLLYQKIQTLAGKKLVGQQPQGDREGGRRRRHR